MMDTTEIDRRDVLRFGATGAAVGLMRVLAPPGAEAAVAADSDQGPSAAPAPAFEVDIPGAPAASLNIREVVLHDLSVDVHASGGATPRLRPGHAHWGSATLTSAVPPGGSKELQAWFMEVVSGKNIRKNITVTLFKSDKSPGRSYNLMDCFPTQWTSVNLDTSSSVQTETIRVKCGRVEFKT